MKVLFIGGTGAISEGVSRVAVERGIDLYLLNRGNRNILIPEGAHLIQGDYNDFQNMQQAIGNHRFDAVVNWIAYTPEQVRKDIQLFRDRTDHYFLISSASAYQKPILNYPTTESTPLINPYWQYSRDKIACEELALAEYQTNGFPATIIRPSHTYGNTLIPVAVGCSGKPWALVDRIRKGKKIIIHGDGTSLWTMTHNTDFAKGLLGLVGNPKAIGQAFQIISDELLSWNQIYAQIARAAGAELHAVHMTSDFLAAVIPDATGNLIGDKANSVVFDNSKLKAFVPEFKATVPFAEGIKKTIAWFEAHPEYCIIDEAWNQRIDQVIDEYESAINSSINRLKG